MDENPYKAPVEHGTPRRPPRFSYLKWYGAMIAIAVATFVTFWVVAWFVA